MKLRAWRRRIEGLALHCTSKGKKAGVQGKVVHFFVAVAYKKGVICCDNTKRLNGDFFASFIRKCFYKYFQASANPRAIRLLKDGDPSQNSAVTLKEMSGISTLLFRIPASSTDLNPIENNFNIASARFKRDTLRKHITHETFKKFSRRVEKTSVTSILKQFTPPLSL